MLNYIVRRTCKRKKGFQFHTEFFNFPLGSCNVFVCICLYYCLRANAGTLLTTEKLLIHGKKKKKTRLLLHQQRVAVLGWAQKADARFVN